MITPISDLPAGSVPVVVSTVYRCFFGYLVGGAGAIQVDGGVAYVRDLRRARNARHWDTTGGSAELASAGPGPAAQLDDRCDQGVLLGVVAIRLATPAAVASWER